MFIAYLAFGFGLIRAAIGLYMAIVIEDMSKNIFLSKRYFSAENSGDVIDRGITMIGVSVVLGILCEISKNRKGSA
jgi:hypothetical protein